MSFNDMLLGMAFLMFAQDKHNVHRFMMKKTSKISIFDVLKNRYFWQFGSSENGQFWVLQNHQKMPIFHEKVSIFRGSKMVVF
jgi:hypothetical protein